MKNSRNRFLSLRNNIVDARDLIRAKRNNLSRLEIDARNLLTNRCVINDKFSSRSNIWKSKEKDSHIFVDNGGTNDNKFNKRYSSNLNYTCKSNGISTNIRSPYNPLFVNNKDPFAVISKKQENSDKPTNICNKNKEYVAKPYLEIKEFKQVSKIMKEKSINTVDKDVPLEFRKSLVSPIQGYRIEVKNLHQQVNVDDVFELFTSLKCDIRTCYLVRPGYAEVVFRTLSDALKSIEEFHGRELDDKPMNIKLVTPARESTTENFSDEISTKLSIIKSSHLSTKKVQINKDLIYRMMFRKSDDVSRIPPKSLQ